MKTAGIFPMVLAIMKMGPGIGVKAAPAVTSPDGTKGIKRKEITAQKTWLTEERCIYSQNGFFSHPGSIFENPNR